MKKLCKNLRPRAITTSNKQTNIEIYMKKFTNNNKKTKIF